MGIIIHSQPNKGQFSQDNSAKAIHGNHNHTLLNHGYHKAASENIGLLHKQES